GPEIRLMQREVGEDNSHQGHVGKVEAFGNHLRADQNIEVSDPEIAEDPPEIVLSLERIGVHPLDAGMRKKLFEGFLDFLCADAAKTDFRVAAFWVWAERGNGFFVGADMAA